MQWSLNQTRIQTWGPPESRYNLSRLMDKLKFLRPCAYNKKSESKESWIISQATSIQTWSTLSGLHCQKHPFSSWQHLPACPGVVLEFGTKCGSPGEKCNRLHQELILGAP
jgi:hypothetical protein